MSHIVVVSGSIPPLQPDGNCMFRAVHDQLRLEGGGSATDTCSHVELRQRAVEHMRQHEADFLPFITQVGIKLGGRSNLC